MSDWAQQAIDFLYLATGVWWGVILHRRHLRAKDRREWPYSWECPHCALRLRSNNPVVAADFPNRHRCGVNPWSTT